MLCKGTWSISFIEIQKSCTKKDKKQQKCKHAFGDEALGSFRASAFFAFSFYR